MAPTGMRAWVKQRERDIETKGKSKATWRVFWNDHDGMRREKSCGPGKEGWRLATKEAQRIHTALVSGTYASPQDKAWTAFVEHYKTDALPRLSAGSQEATLQALRHLERLVAPRKMSDISARMIDRFIAKRRKERGRRKGDTVSPATINKELRHIRAVLNKARKWRYIVTTPEIEFEPELEKEPTFMTSDHFTAIYDACGAAKQPNHLSYPANDWWQGLLIIAYMTGWRIGEPLSLKRNDVDLKAGTARLKATNTKGKRYAVYKLHPIVLDHLRGLQTFEPMMFPWKLSRRAVYEEFYRIQKAAGIHLPCDGDHEHTDACHLYGFHDERRAFATLNAGKLSAVQLQSLMRHKTYATTQRYINMSFQLDTANDVLHVPSGIPSKKT